MASTLEMAINNAQVRANALNLECLTGKAAFAKEDKPARRDLGEVIFSKGDTFVIPKDESSEQWISAPVSRDGQPITRAIVEVTSADGTVSAKELFIGTLNKTVIDRVTKQPVSVGGNITSYTTGKPLNSDIWKALFGKTITVTNEKKVATIRRGFNGQPDREVETSVLSFDVK